MKILVVDDREKHRQSARETLGGHNLTIATGFDVAMRLIQPLGTPFEVVLTDMMLPPTNLNLLPEFVSGQQVPYGFIIALRAVQCGARWVAMITDTNHHRAALSEGLDHIGPAYYPPEEVGPEYQIKPFVINGAKIWFGHAPFLWDPFIGDPAISPPKDWGRVLRDLLKG